MRLFDLISKHKLAHLAKIEDNEKILHFFNSSAMKGKGLALRYDRSPDFFRFLSYQSPDHFVFWFGENEMVEGVGTVVIRPGMIGGKKTMVGYLGDLRFNHSKKMALAWRRFYSELMLHAPEIEEFKGCRHFLTAIIDENKSAQNSLVNSSKNTFYYSSKINYEMINVFQRKPFHFCSKKSYSIVSKASVEDFPLIKSFLKKNHQKRPFGFVFSEFDYDELDYRLKNWDQFLPGQILVAKKDQEIVGVTGLWSPRNGKKIIVDKIPAFQNFFFKCFSPFVTVPKIHQELNLLYLTLLTFEDPQVVRDFVDYILKNKLNSKQMIALTNFPEKSFLPYLSDYFYISKSMKLFQVYDKSRLEDDIEFLNIPGFEMSLV